MKDSISGSKFRTIWLDDQKMTKKSQYIFKIFFLKKLLFFINLVDFRSIYRTKVYSLKLIELSNHFVLIKEIRKSFSPTLPEILRLRILFVLFFI